LIGDTSMKGVVIAILTFLSLSAVASGAAGAQEAGEAERIRQLIAAVETLPGAVFIRNGVEYNAKAAADHLRLKLKAAGDRVRTAEDFIRLCASQSSMTGEKYRIRMADGTVLEAETFFRNRLKTPSRP
jgi:hypothetical protein